MSPAIRPLVSTGCVTYDVKRVVEIGLLHTNGDAAECKRALCAMKTCSPKHVAPGFTLVPALRGRFRAFTLVEMLIVMIIMLIALGALIPAVTSLSKSNGRQAATSNLIGAIEQARAEAIKSGQPTYVVFPTFTSGTQSTLDRYNYRSYAIFEDDAASPTPSPTPPCAGNVKQLTPWKSLPTGVALRAAGDTALLRLVDSRNLIPAVTLPCFGPDPGASPTYWCFKFNPNGEVESPPNNVSLGIFEGFINGTGEVITGAKDGSGNPLAAEYVSVSRISGRAEPTAAPTP